MPRRPRGGLAAWLKDAATPLYLTDSRRVVLFFNQGCEELTGWTAAEVVGSACDYASEPTTVELDALTCALAPPPEAIQGHCVTLQVAVPTRGQGLQSRTALFLPLPGDRPEDLRILCAWLPAKQTVELPSQPGSPSELHAELARLREELSAEYQIDQVIARSSSMQRVLAQVQLASEGTTSVHLSGPEGSGREFLARVIHLRSARRLRPFVPLDCSLLPARELERTLQRIWTPSHDDKDDPSQTLRPGTVLLRNVSRMPRDVQQTLLNVLASTATADSDDIALYSLDAEPLDQAVVQEQLLPELYYRLTTITIDVPALRDRMDDLPLLAQFFVERLNRSSDQQLSGVSLQTLELFRSYNWPGNVRELRAVVEEAHATTTGPQIDIGDLPFRLRTGLDAQRIIPPRETPPLDLEAYLRDIEARGIRRVLGECRENRAKAARLLGMTRTKLYRRMEQLGISSGSEEAGEASGG